jgi:hypothetical protein
MSKEQIEKESEDLHDRFPWYYENSNGDRFRFILEEMAKIKARLNEIEEDLEQEDEP